MAICGYICPLCEGSTIKEDGTECGWCLEKPPIKGYEVLAKELTQEEWIAKVHEGPCCSD